MWLEHAGAAGCRCGPDRRADRARRPRGPSFGCGVRAAPGGTARSAVAMSRQYRGRGRAGPSARRPPQKQGKTIVGSGAHRAARRERNDLSQPRRCGPGGALVPPPRRRSDAFREKRGVETMSKSVTESFGTSRRASRAGDRRQQRHRRRRGAGAGRGGRQGRRSPAVTNDAAGVGRPPSGDQLCRRRRGARGRRRPHRRRGPQPSRAPRRADQQRRHPGDRVRWPTRRPEHVRRHLGDERRRPDRDDARGAAAAAQVEGARSSTWRRSIADQPFANMSVYCASKAAVLALTRALGAGAGPRRHPRQRRQPGPDRDADVLGGEARDRRRAGAVVGGAGTGAAEAFGKPEEVAR